MNVFKELWQIIKLLFTSKPKDFNELEILKMNNFPFTGYLAMTWCGKLITRYPEKIDKQTITHETIHLKQAQNYGSWIAFYATYLLEWIKGNPIISPMQSAYYTIPFEVEAYANEDNNNYPNNYTTNNLKTKYNLKDRKNLYRQYGKTRYDWMKYIKGL